MTKLVELSSDVAGLKFNNKHIDRGGIRDVINSEDLINITSNVEDDSLIGAFNEVIIRSCEKSEGQDLFIDIATLASGDNDHSTMLFFMNVDILPIKAYLSQYCEAKVYLRFLKGFSNIERIECADKSCLMKYFTEELSAFSERVIIFYGGYTINFSEVIEHKNSCLSVLENNCYIEHIILKHASKIASNNRRFEHFIEILVDVLNDVLSKDFLSIIYGWNHAKIFSINGLYSVQGGANFWKEYSSGYSSPGDLCTISQGSIAGLSHRYCDNIWNEISNQYNSQFSVCESYDYLSDTFSTTSAVRMYSDNKDQHSDYNTIGLWYGRPDSLYYPIIDAVLSRMYWKYKRISNDTLGGFLYCLSSFDDFLVDIVKEFLSGFDIESGWENNIECLYKGRIYRNNALSSAQSSIRLKQQKIVLDDLPSKMQQKNIWDTDDYEYEWYIWPIDTLLSIAKAIIEFIESDKYKINNSPFVLEVVCSYSSEKKKKYGDPIGKNEFLLIMRSLGVDLNNDKVDFSYTACDIPGNHSKVIVVDDEIAYIGSENIYPTYHQQFGVWSQVMKCDVDEIMR